MPPAGVPGEPVDAAARAVADLALSRPSTLGEGRLVCVDGPAGSGKTTLAASLLERCPGGRVVHMDDLYDGWEGLPRVADQLPALLAPLARGAAGRYRRYDWHAGRYAEEVPVDPVPLLVVEGVGSGSRSIAELITVLVWVTAPPGLRRARGLARDGEAMAPAWDRWVRDEAAHLAREQTEARADVLVDGTGERPVVVRPRRSGPPLSCP